MASRNNNKTSKSCSSSKSKKNNGKETQKEKSSDSLQDFLLFACSKLSLSFSYVLNGYLLGSRLWNTHNTHSDYDLLIIVDDRTPLVCRPSTDKRFVSVHTGTIDALIMAESLFKERIQSYSIQEVLTLWLPKSHILKQTFDPLVFWEYNHNKLVTAVFSSVLERDWKITKKRFEKGMIERGKKTIVHSLRVLLLTLQIITEARITNYEAATDYFYGMKEHGWEEEAIQTPWLFYSSIYRPQLLALINQIWPNNPNPPLLQSGERTLDLGNEEDET